MRTGQDGRGALAAAMAVAVSGWVLAGTPGPAAAGVVRVEGTVVVFEAGNNEVNTVVIDARGSALDQASGQFVQGFTVRDSTAPIGAGPGCRAFTGAVVCDIVGASAVALDLGDRNDRVSQDESEPGDAVPMQVKGGAGRDVLTGGPRGDTLDGELDDDTLDGGGGNDVLEGGFGTDVLTGGSGADSISGGAGDDTVRARDGETDTIRCGLGRDSVTADPSDVQRRCN